MTPFGRETVTARWFHCGGKLRGGIVLTDLFVALKILPTMQRGIASAWCVNPQPFGVSLRIKKAAAWVSIGFRELLGQVVQGGYGTTSLLEISCKRRALGSQKKNSAVRTVLFSRFKANRLVLFRNWETVRAQASDTLGLDYDVSFGLVGANGLVPFPATVEMAMRR